MISDVNPTDAIECNRRWEVELCVSCRAVGDPRSCASEREDLPGGKNDTDFVVVRVGHDELPSGGDGKSEGRIELCRRTLPVKRTEGAARNRAHKPRV
jgi:hypothetical protein